MANSPHSEQRAQVLLDVAQDEAVLPVRRQQEETEMDITPMIDITFLLLIFFIVASKLDSDSAVPLPTARHADAINMTDAVVVTVTDLDSTAKIYLGNSTDASKRVTGATPLDQEDQIMQYVIDTISSNPSKKYIVVKAAEGLHHRDVARVAKAAGTAAAEAKEGTTLYFAVMEGS